MSDVMHCVLVDCFWTKGSAYLFLFLSLPFSPVIYSACTSPVQLSNWKGKNGTG